VNASVCDQKQIAQVVIRDQVLYLTPAGAANLRKNTLAHTVLQKAEREWRAKHPDAPLYNTADTASAATAAAAAAAAAAAGHSEAAACDELDKLAHLELD
jgi:hypothetical protein